MPRFQHSLMAASLGLLSLGVALTPNGRAGDIGFVEDFALSKDRPASLKQLIPGTDDFYYYHGLHYLQTEQFEKVEPLTVQWYERHKQTVRLTEIQTRHALLTYDKNPEKSLAYIRSRLGVRFEPEKFRQIEMGIKTSLLSGMTATAALFSLTRDNILVTDPLDAAFLVQGGRERSRGGEIDVVWEPSRSLMLRGGYAYLNSKIIDDTNVARIGLRKPNAPEHQFNLYAAYTFQAGALENLRLSAGVVYSGSTFAAITNTIKRPEYTIANLNASYKVGRYRFDAIASNVFDETYFLARNNAQVNAGEPRQLLFRVSTRL